MDGDREKPDRKRGMEGGEHLVVIAGGGHGRPDALMKAGRARIRA